MENKGSATTYNPNGAADFSNSKKVSESLGKCATYVKNSITSINAGKLNNNTYPSGFDACTFAHWMPWWGFKLVCTGETKECPSSFTPLDGDIMVNAGLANVTDKRQYGHVSVYKKGVGWIADFASSGPGCYGANSGRNYWTIWRK